MTVPEKRARNNALSFNIDLIQNSNAKIFFFFFLEKKDGGSQNHNIQDVYKGMLSLRLVLHLR